MKTKWYFGALIIVMTLLGVYQNTISEPNQEIVLKFTDVDITSEEAQSTISLVKEQLQAIGVDIVQVQELKAGQLKIAYFSTADVASIKEILSKGKNLKIGYTSNNQDENTSGVPSHKKSKRYKLDVYEIHKSTDFASGLDGKLVLNPKLDYNRFYNPNIIVLNNDIDAKGGNAIIKVAFKLYVTIAIAIDNTSRNIPEVRAGPTTTNERA
ncbi:MAG: hypothetical protein ACI9OE_001472 [Mariniflexile sp.]|jgi:hypothetical protein